MGIVTGTIVTLDQSIIESNAKKYVGYITRCDNSYSYNGTWSPNTSVTGIGVSVSDSVISVWNTNSTTEDVSIDFTWTSSKLSDCIKKFTVVAKGKNCPTYNVILVSEFNDDSDGLLESVSGNVQLYLYSVVGSGGTSSDAVCSNDINKVGEVTSQPSTIPNNCSGVNNVKFIFDNVDLTCSFSGNIGNFTVSGGIEYRLGDSGSYTVLYDSVKNYTVSTTSNSATIGKCDIEDTTLWAMMDGSKTLYLKHVITMNYDISVEHAYVYWKQFSQVEVTEISRTLTVNSGFVYKPGSNLVEPFVLVDEDGNMITDINEYSIVDSFGEVDITDSCKIENITGGYPTHTRMCISWNGEDTLPGWVSVRNGGNTNGTSASAGFYVVAKNTKLKVTFNCNWSAINTYKFVIQDLSWSDSIFKFSDLFNSVNITCCQGSCCYTTTTLDVNSVYVTGSKNSNTTVNATFKFKNLINLPAALKSYVSSGGKYKIVMQFAYPTSQSKVYSDNQLMNTNYDVDFNLSWTFNGSTSLSVKFYLEKV